MSTVYSISKHNTTNEQHIFVGQKKPYPSNECTADQLSICQKMDRNDGQWVDGAGCKDEAQMRNKCAEIGRNVCGVCVSHLYTTY